MSKAFTEISAGLKDAIAYAGGETTRTPIKPILLTIVKKELLIADLFPYAFLQIHNQQPFRGRTTGNRCPQLNVLQPIRVITLGLINLKTLADIVRFL